MTTLRDRFDHVTTDLETDLVDLAEQARRRGEVVRRRRRAGAVGAAAAAAAVVAGVALVPGLGGPAPDASPATSSPSASASSSAATGAPAVGGVPLNGRAATALLEQVLGDVAPGAGVSDRAGAGRITDPRPHVYGSVALEPVAGQGAGTVFVEVWGSAMVAEAGEPVCRPTLVDCRTSRLADGDTLVTYRLPADDGSITHVAEVWRADRSAQVVVGASNALDVPGGDLRVTRPQAVLDADQVAAIAEDDRWGTEVDASVAERGRALEPYRTYYGRSIWLPLSAVAGRD